MGFLDFFYTTIGILAISLVIIVLVFKHKLKNRDKIIQEREETIQEKEEIIQSLENEIEQMKAILPNARKEANEIVNGAKARAEMIVANAQEKANNLIRNAEEKGNTIVQNAQQEATALIEETRTRAKRILTRSYELSELITREAYENARSISSEVFEKINMIDELEKTIQAYKNELKNYEYEVSFKEGMILDQWAEIYGFKEAGQKLKEARQKTKSLIESEKAAMSEYVEYERRKTAINFLVELFNTKVDIILSKIKHDNYDKLKQQIIDTYHIVNNLGSAFRNTKITAEYLNARLEELKWGTIVAKIRYEEREEQKRIREQIREEERARKERERALKEAQKEEEMLKKAMALVEKQMKEAAEKEKEKLMEEMEKLKQKLQKAEEKSQRAKSMAELTKSGHVYIISNIGSFGENVYKVGMTRRLDPMDRIRELGDASVPFPFDVHAIIYSDNAPALENKLHRFLEDKRLNKVNPRKEFFKVTLQEIKDFLDKEGIKAEWTMMAEAAEYRESLAIEKSMKKINEQNKEMEKV